MNYINIGIFITALLSIVLVLLQDRGSEGGAFTSGDMGGFYQKRRGMEKAIFVMTIVSIAAFAGFSLLRITHLGNIGTATTTGSTNPVELKTDNPNVKIITTPGAPSTGTLAPATTPAPTAPAPSPAK